MLGDGRPCGGDGGVRGAVRGGQRRLLPQRRRRRRVRPPPSGQALPSRRRRRPARRDGGRVSASACSSPALALAALASRWQLVLVVAAYIVVTLAYSAYLKHIAVVDLVSVALGFVLRAVAGAVAVDVVMSNWFLLCISFGSMFIVTGKRYAELLQFGDDAVHMRPSLDAYNVAFLRAVIGVSASITVVSYCLWAFEKADTTHVSWPMYQLSIVPVVDGAAALRPRPRDRAGRRAGRGVPVRSGAAGRRRRVGRAVRPRSLPCLRRTMLRRLGRGRRRPPPRWCRRGALGECLRSPPDPRRGRPRPGPGLWRRRPERRRRRRRHDHRTRDRAGARRRHRHRDGERGTTFEELLRFLLPRGWFVPVTPGTRHVTVGGAVAADVHGKNHVADGSWMDHVTAIDLALAGGEVRTVGPDRRRARVLGDGRRHGAHGRGDVVLVPAPCRSRRAACSSTPSASPTSTPCSTR